MGRTVDKERLDKVLELREQGMTIQEIAKIIGVSHVTIYNWLKKEEEERTGVKRQKKKRGKKKTEEEKQEELAKNPDKYKKKEWSMTRAEPLKGGAMQSLERYCTATDEEISQLMGNVVKWRQLGKMAPVKTDEECAERLDAFFDYIIRTGEKPSIEKMALALGVVRATINAWKNGVYGSKTRQAMICQAIEALAAMDAELVNNNKIPQVTYIFRSKNFFGMKDQTEVVHTSQTRAEIDEEELRKRIMQGVIESAQDGDYVEVE